MYPNVFQCIAMYSELGRSECTYSNVSCSVSCWDTYRACIWNVFCARGQDTCHDTCIEGKLSLIRGKTVPRPLSSAPTNPPPQQGKAKGVPRKSNFAVGTARRPLRLHGEVTFELREEVFPPQGCRKPVLGKSDMLLAGHRPH